MEVRDVIASASLVNGCVGCVACVTWPCSIFELSLVMPMIYVRPAELLSGACLAAMRLAQTALYPMHTAYPTLLYCAYRPCIPRSGSAHPVHSMLYPPVMCLQAMHPTLRQCAPCGLNAPPLCYACRPCSSCSEIAHPVHLMLHPCAMLAWLPALPGNDRAKAHSDRLEARSAHPKHTVWSALLLCVQAWLPALPADDWAGNTEVCVWSFSVAPFVPLSPIALFLPRCPCVAARHPCIIAAIAPLLFSSLLSGLLASLLLAALLPGPLHHCSCVTALCITALSLCHCCLLNHFQALLPSDQAHAAITRAHARTHTCAHTHTHTYSEAWRWRAMIEEE
eukprot:161280-Pelagomonas_calceolata.AAC.2